LLRIEKRETITQNSITIIYKIKTQSNRQCYFAINPELPVYMLNMKYQSSGT